MLDTQFTMALLSTYASGGPDRAKISQTYTLKRIDYSLRMARRMSEDTH